MNNYFGSHCGGVSKIICTWVQEKKTSTETTPSHITTNNSNKLNKNIKKYFH
jgi:hypothetical protein